MLQTKRTVKPKQNTLNCKITKSTSKKKNDDSNKKIFKHLVVAEKQINVSPQENDDHNLQLNKQLIVKLMQSLHKTT